VVTEGVLTVKGIDQEGYREILSVAVAPTEEKATWGSVFSDLIDRGLEPREIKYIVSDEHKGLKKALRRYFPKAIWQRCQAHYTVCTHLVPEKCWFQGVAQSPSGSPSGTA